MKFMKLTKNHNKKNKSHLKKFNNKPTLRSCNQVSQKVKLSTFYNTFQIY